MTPDREADARGLRCPLPSLRARKVLAGMQEGEVLRLLADDPMAAIDLPHLCAEGGHAYLGAEGDAHLLRRGPDRGSARGPDGAPGQG